MSDLLQRVLNCDHCDGTGKDQFLEECLCCDGTGKYRSE